MKLQQSIENMKSELLLLNYYKCMAQKINQFYVKILNKNLDKYFEKFHEHPDNTEQAISTKINSKQRYIKYPAF